MRKLLQSGDFPRSRNSTRIPPQNRHFSRICVEREPDRAVGSAIATVILAPTTLTPFFGLHQVQRMFAHERVTHTIAEMTRCELVGQRGHALSTDLCESFEILN